MRDAYRDVGDFHEKFGLVNFCPERRADGIAPAMLPPDVHEFRRDFMQEELDEYHAAVAEGNLGKAIDALVDLTYVALGTAHMHGVDFGAHWDLVHAANMAKERATSADDERSTRRHSLNVVKPAGWVAPDHFPILQRTFNDFMAARVERSDV